VADEPWSFDTLCAVTRLRPMQRDEARRHMTAPATMQSMR